MSPADTASGASASPLVTIVTPAYNQAEYLAETIDSVLAQDYPNIEYIVIDDGSTDRTREILHQYDGRIRWASQENMGQAATLNKGWGMGAGEIIGYLSSDDLLKPNAVSESVRCLLRHPEVVLVYPDFELIDSRSHLIRCIEAADFNYRNMVVDLVCYPGPGAFFRRSGFDRTGPWNEDLRQMPDLEYWLRLSQVGSFKRIPEWLASSRVHEASQSFRAVSIQRAMEPVRCVAGLIASRTVRIDGPHWIRWSTASARVLVFRLLWRSGLYRLGLKQLLRAVKLRPGLMGRPAFWRMVLSAFVGKRFYRLISETEP